MKMDTGERLRRLSFEETGFQQWMMIIHASVSDPRGTRASAPSPGRELTVGASGGAKWLPSLLLLVVTTRSPALPPPSFDEKELETRKTRTMKETENEKE